MPQINRIRVNNVKYNFGTQYYDDFMMRFNCKNTIYDLANGGGKSLLMLLLMQNVIPNCTLDDKQPIEKLFRTGCDNTTIHSLVEWKLDSCYQRDNYKYMTTGFCARKGRSGEDNGDVLSEVSDIDVANENGQTVNKAVSKDTASVEYFNYCIFYREFGDNDIRNLPLVSNGERITYNGLKSYLRDLEKKDLSVSVKIFDKKGDYQSFISQYGIFESEWEIIRGINKTEGHVRTYFETNYKTSRKVIEDLLIEEIIQKSYNNALSVENDEQTMAKTLLDIKDKLVELSKKHAKMKDYDNQIAAIKGFSDYAATFKDLYVNKARLEDKLLAMYSMSKQQSKKQESSLNELSELIDSFDEKIACENKYIQTARVIREQKSLKTVEELVKATQQNINTREQLINAKKTQLINMESANDYRDFKRLQKDYSEITITLNNFLRDHTDIINELKALSYLYKNRYDGILHESGKKVEEALKRFDELNEKKQMLLDNLKAAEKECARISGSMELTNKQIELLEARLTQEMKKSSIIVAENAEDEISELKQTNSTLMSSLKASEIKLKEVNEQLSNKKYKRTQYEVNCSFLNDKLNELRKDSERTSTSDKRIQELIQIYNVAHKSELDNAILAIYKENEAKLINLEREIENHQAFIDNTNKGIYTCDSPLRNRLKEYLINQYKEDVVEGHEWFRRLNPGQRRDIKKRAPFIEYAFIIKNDFERIKADRNISNFERGAYVIPVVSEQILYDMKLEVNNELVSFAMKNVDFLYDDARRETEIRIASEELDNLYASHEKVKDCVSIIWEDYKFVLSLSLNTNKHSIKNEIDDTEKRLTEYSNEIEVINDNISILEKQSGIMEKEISDCRSQHELNAGRISSLENVISCNNELKQQYDVLTDEKNSESAAKQTTADIYSEINFVVHDITEAQNVYNNSVQAYDELTKRWRDLFQEYYDEDYSCDDKYLNNKNALSTESLEQEFQGLKAIVEKEQINVEDKKNLQKHLSDSMEKCKQAIEYRGVSFNDIEKLYKESDITTATPMELNNLKKEVKDLYNEQKQYENELEAQNAMRNRLDGSIAHGISQIEENFGSFTEIECENPDQFIEQHSRMIKDLQQNKKDSEANYKNELKASKETFLIEKNLERIVKQAGLNPSAAINASNEDLSGTAKLEDYESLQNDYEALLKLLYKKRDEFEKNKAGLVIKLNDLDSAELSNEFKLSINVPENIEETDKLVLSLIETNTFIDLEKNRITKGIEDMERIKDNFENRCIQTCCNIKTELDRLPGLSVINLDDERISMINLNIPYVNEKIYKERMSAYIDETVLVAESFKNTQERLSYIKNRLTWKKLFSVIVTDMNAIRLNLYKRERIKDQSRYLKYEEAVGSTGQSQGIYIQFLIAIINYISSINAAVRNDEIVGNTIFIDNPFGAAKDIYIWEPIFKLLKTNHVQLIVPARGASMAITGRFEVNYILGQKLVGDRQQTVVVDYYSKTNESQLEYVKMDYEQASFDFS